MQPFMTPMMMGGGGASIIDDFETWETSGFPTGWGPDYSYYGGGPPPTKVTGAFSGSFAAAMSYSDTGDAPNTAMTKTFSGVGGRNRLRLRVSPSYTSLYQWVLVLGRDGGALGQVFASSTATTGVFCPQTGHNYVEVVFAFDPCSVLTVHMPGYFGGSSQNGDGDLNPYNVVDKLEIYAA